MKDSNFKVVIVGGSVAGLSLANMLQANNIDFIVLEAYSDIAPQIGASIGLLPHGNRILDQLGLYEKVSKLATAIDSFTFRTETGSPIASHSGVRNSFVQRHGFPINFMDRQMLLQVLYDNIKDKSKVLTGKRVKTIQTRPGSAAAITTDNSVYEGDMVIGADGIHSTVRTEMWRLAHKQRPGWFDPAEEQAAPCEYSCIFGISNAVHDIPAGAMNEVFRDGSSYLVIGGPSNRVYWFRFQKLPRTLYGTEIPRYTEADSKKAASEALDENITADTKFAALAKGKISGSMTALAEYVFKKWYFDRVICIGDSSHKFHPIGGHGGNAAIESAAVLTNALVEALDKSSSGRLSGSEIERIYSSVQEIRRDRTISCKEYSHEQQRTEALDSISKRIQALYLLPFVDREEVTFNFSSKIPQAEKLNMLDVKQGERLIPFKDGLLSSPRGRGSMQWILIAFFLSVAALTHYGMWVQSGSWELGGRFVEILTTGAFPQDKSFALKRTYTGIGPLDEYLTFLTAVFIPGLRGWEKSFRMLQIYFLGHLIQPIAIWTVEARRNKNIMTPMAIPILWFTVFQSAGIGIYMPIYYAVYTFISDAEAYWWPLRRRVPLHYSKTILPANIIGYVLPTILMFVHWSEASTAQNFEVLWQFAPMLAPFLLTIFGAIHKRVYPNPEPEKVREYSKDLGDLKQLYVVTGILGVILHCFVVVKLVSSTDSSLSLSSVFVPDFSTGPQALGEGLRNLFLADFWGFYVATYVWCVSAVWDLKRVGRTTVNVTKVSILILVAHIFVGPGAVHSAVWYWREDKLARTIFL